MTAITSETLLNKINEATEALQNAQQTVVAAKEEIIAAPRIAQEANATANAAKQTAEAASAAADAAKAQADKAGGTVTGVLIGSLPDTVQQEPFVAINNKLDLQNIDIAIHH